MINRKTVISFALTSALFSFIQAQELDRAELAKHCLEQYFQMLATLNEARSRPAQNPRTIEIMCDLLNKPEVVSPFKSLFENCPSPDRTTETYTVYPDCLETELRMPIGEFLYHFATNPPSRKPVLLDHCVLSVQDRFVEIQYRSRNELLEVDCGNQNTERVAFVNFDQGDAYISHIRWATEEEIANSCLQSVVSQEEPPAPDREAEVRALQAQVSRLERQINDLHEQRGALQANEEELNQTLRTLEETGLRYRSRIDSLNSVVQQSGRNMDKVLRELERTERLLEDNKQLIQQYRKEVNSEWSQYARQYEDLNREFSSLSTKYYSFIDHYEKFAYSRTHFIGLNYGLIQAPFGQVAGNELSIDPIKRSFKSTEVQSNFGISVYHLVGGFISNVRINSRPEPDNYYTQIEVDQIKEDLFISGVDFTELEYATSDHNLNAVNFGFYFYTRFEETPIINGFFVMAGISYLKGHVWDYYDGDFGSTLDRDPDTDMYIIDMEHINTTGAILGLAYVKPYFQVELGYNTLYSDFFMNIGANYPISGKVKSGVPTRSEVPEVKELRNSLNEIKETIPRLRR